mmetsp:Transcript_29530/g.92122  ORF Transcript_29530/g.92122 Transcript_29530/m.92122 type:complete len:110 (+) Transcript_29530:343-672(+)
MRMVPASYPASPLAHLVANAFGTFQIMLIGLVFMVSDKMLPEGLRENKLALVMAIFFMCSTMASAITKTNAFEIYVGRKLVFSKLRSGRMPNMRDLINGFKSVGVTISQ